MSKHKCTFKLPPQEIHLKTFTIKFFHNDLGIHAVIIYFHCMLIVRKKTDKIFILIII